MVLVFHWLKFFIPSLSSHVNDICKDIISIRLRCGSNNISKVFISSIAYSSQINAVLMQILNRALYDECRDLVLHPSIILLLLKMIFGLMEFICKKAVNALLPIIWSFFRICKSAQVVSMKKNLLLSESESVRQNTLDENKECYPARSLTDQSEKNSINTTPNSLSKIKEIRIGNANKVVIGNLNIKFTKY